MTLRTPVKAPATTVGAFDYVADCRASDRPWQDKQARGCARTGSSMIMAQRRRSRSDDHGWRIFP